MKCQVVNILNMFLFYSPTCTRLTSAESVRQYLVTDGTCKCGLECPFHIDKVFNFSSEVISIKWTQSSIKDTGNLCNHKRKYSAMSACQTTRSSVGLRPDISLVSSSAMMSPRVSSTVQENQDLCKFKIISLFIHFSSYLQVSFH